MTQNSRRVKVLVTGATGFIGSHLVEALLRRDCDVIGLDRRSPYTDPIARHNARSFLQKPAFSLVVADLIAANLASLVDGVDCVFHLAAVPGVRPSWDRFDGYVSANIESTGRLLSACAEAGVPRLVYASSSSVYGENSTASREGDVAQPISPYGVSKLAGEQLSLAYAKRPGSSLRVTALRYFTVYGPRQRPDMATGRILAAALTGGQYTLYGDGAQRREFTYVSDVIDATIAAADVRENAAVVNVGGGTSVSMTDLIALAREATGKPVPVKVTSEQFGDVTATEADLTLARTLIGYQPKVDLRTGISRQAEWLRQLPPELLGRYISRLQNEEVAACSI
ncbi:NAD-dependent epimerase/dehydratase family protein [Micromonospora sp. NPDC085948]|uniref:NAD-dependent epimerase/dehydratase family protein n=1 Tax=Micromonospora sp. NPDC085948 TaxID=3155293 RepID=UPI00341751C1